MKSVIYRERERDDGERPKQARPERSSSAAANGRSSRSPNKHSRLDWAAYKRDRDAIDPAPKRLKDALLNDRDTALTQEAKRGRRNRSYSTSEDRD